MGIYFSNQSKENSLGSKQHVADVDTSSYGETYT